MDFVFVTRFVPWITRDVQGCRRNATNSCLRMTHIVCVQDVGDVIALRLCVAGSVRICLDRPWRGSSQCVPDDESNENGGLQNELSLPLSSFPLPYLLLPLTPLLLLLFLHLFRLLGLMGGVVCV